MLLSLLQRTAQPTHVRIGQCAILLWFQKWSKKYDAENVNDGDDDDDDVDPWTRGPMDDPWTRGPVPYLVSFTPLL